MATSRNQHRQNEQLSTDPIAGLPTLEIISIGKVRHHRHRVGHGESGKETGIEMSDHVKYCGIAQPSWTTISPTDQCLIASRSQRESRLISSNIKALSIQSACKPEKRTRPRARMS